MAAGWGYHFPSCRASALALVVLTVHLGSTHALRCGSIIPTQQAAGECPDLCPRNVSSVCAIGKYPGDTCESKNDCVLRLPCSCSHADPPVCKCANEAPAANGKVVGAVAAVVAGVLLAGAAFVLKRDGLDCHTPSDTSPYTSVVVNSVAFIACAIYAAVRGSPPPPSDLASVSIATGFFAGLGGIAHYSVLRTTLPRLGQIVSHGVIIFIAVALQLGGALFLRRLSTTLEVTSITVGGVLTFLSLWFHAAFLRVLKPTEEETPLAAGIRDSAVSVARSDADVGAASLMDTSFIARFPSPQREVTALVTAAIAGVAVLSPIVPVLWISTSRRVIYSIRNVTEYSDQPADYAWLPMLGMALSSVAFLIAVAFGCPSSKAATLGLRFTGHAALGGALFGAAWCLLLLACGAISLAPAVCLSLATAPAAKLLLGLGMRRYNTTSAKVTTVMMVTLGSILFLLAPIPQGER